jgi:hypothetical protein
MRRSPAAPRRQATASSWAGTAAPAGRGGRQNADHQALPGYQQTAKDSPTDADAEGGGDPPWPDRTAAE